ncbi:MAG: S24/S26 family peptidase [Desulfobacula sp.]|uniref:S24/S26 family peptidase n=1 Tax=Desulfobacula sp. TaxID=2593537 RepID=UPI001D9B711E|nr:S24/S26 family peptidase [Desulfobacula sp.]MBT3806670.1 S24/S26 family peptidase [Desulfobacula sp.]MBT4505958.1 S24/S26 family peptidase [Desulfobacula sp.]MBT5971010.1 S24/S26 family peptidase [Desulfobacula sp.]MBT6341107.1 S24/S26 family peptidase [Desulfobacula sp.]
MKIELNKILLSSKQIASLLKKTCEKQVSFKFTAKGMSMSPFICDGDSLIIKPFTRGKKPGIGDIIAFINPVEGYLVIHRVIKIKNKQYLLKGDNVYYHDGYCDDKDIHGIVKNIILARKTFQGPKRLLRNSFLYLNDYKKTMAFLSRYKILTLVCRLINKLI